MAAWKYINTRKHQQHVGDFGDFGFGDDFGWRFGGDAWEDDDETDGDGDARGSRAWGVDRDVCERQTASVGERER